MHNAFVGWSSFLSVISPPFSTQHFLRINLSHLQFSSCIYTSPRREKSVQWNTTWNRGRGRGEGVLSKRVNLQMCSSPGCHIIRDQIESTASHILNCNLKYQEAQMPMAFPVFPQLIPLSPRVMLLAPPPLTGQVELNPLTSSGPPFPLSV